MLESFFRTHLLGKRVSSFMCQNVVLLFTRCCHSFLIKEVSWICFTISGVQVSVGIFRSCLFVCQRDSRFQMVVLLYMYLGVVSQFFYQRSCMDILVNIFRSSGIWVCLSRFCCQRFSNCQSVCQSCWRVYWKCLLSEIFNCQFVKDVEVFLQAPWVLFVRGFYGLGIGRFLHVQSVCQRFWYQKVSSGPVF